MTVPNRSIHSLHVIPHELSIGSRNWSSSNSVVVTTQMSKIDKISYYSAILILNCQNHYR